MGKFVRVKINLGILRYLKNSTWNKQISQFPKNGQLARPAPELLYKSSAKSLSALRVNMKNRNSKRAVNRQPGYRPGDS